MKKLLYAVAAIVVSLSAVSCSEETKSTSVEPMNIEFWEVCEGSKISELYHFFYYEADQLVTETLIDAAEEGAIIPERPFSSLLVTEYEVMDGSKMTAPVGGGLYVAAANKDNMKRVDEYLQYDNVRARLDEITEGQVKLAWSNKNTLGGSRGGVFTLYALQGNGGMIPAMDGSGIVEAKAVTGQFGGYEVSISMNNETAIEWANLTEKNIGKPLAIVMDNVVYSAPYVNDRIDGGNSSISGNFTLTEALVLAKLINAN